MFAEGDFGLLDGLLFCFEVGIDEIFLWYEARYPAEGGDGFQVVLHVGPPVYKYAGYLVFVQDFFGYQYFFQGVKVISSSKIPILFPLFDQQALLLMFQKNVLVYYQIVE